MPLCSSRRAFFKKVHCGEARHFLQNIFLKVFSENAPKTVLPMPFRESSPNCVTQTLFRCTFSEKIPRITFQNAFPMRFLETRPSKAFPEGFLDTLSQKHVSAPLPKGAKRGCPFRDIPFCYSVSAWRPDAPALLGVAAFWNRLRSLSRSPKETLGAMPGVSALRRECGRWRG